MWRAYPPRSGGAGPDYGWAGNGRWTRAAYADRSSLRWSSCCSSSASRADRCSRSSASATSFASRSARDPASEGLVLELTGSVLELECAVLDAGVAYRQGALAVRELGLCVAQLLLADVEALQPALDLGLPDFDLAAERLLPLRDANALGLDLLGDALLAVAALGFRLGELALELLDPSP